MQHAIIEPKDREMLGRFFDKFCFNTIFLAGFILILAIMQLPTVFKKSEGETMTETKPGLPRSVGLWTGPDSPRIVDADNIFDYMNGAGELYLGYRFDHCEVYDYLSPEQKEILVELYFMESPDDAFGLLSLDWGGAAVGLSPESGKADPDCPGWPWALYGEGLLRLRSGNIYARVMATQETPESREAVLSIGKAIVKDRENHPCPEFWGELPESLPSGWVLRRDRAGYFRTHLVLNSLYYIGHQNILDLDLACEAFTAPYERKSSAGTGSRRVQFLSVRYPDTSRALAAIARFHRAYLPEHPFVSGTGASGGPGGVFSVEAGWLAYQLRGRTAFFAFDCPDEKTARMIMDRLH